MLWKFCNGPGLVLPFMDPRSGWHLGDSIGNERKVMVSEEQLWELLRLGLQSPCSASSGREGRSSIANHGDVVMFKKYISRGPHLRTRRGQLRVSETCSSGVAWQSVLVHSRVAAHLVVVPSGRNTVAPSLRTWGSFVTLPEASAFCDQPLGTQLPHYLI